MLQDGATHERYEIQNYRISGVRWYLFRGFVFQSISNGLVEVIGWSFHPTDIYSVGCPSYASKIYHR
jgi:hypothetical protein